MVGKPFKAATGIELAGKVMVPEMVRLDVLRFEL
jgi:hypothetical protein